MAHSITARALETRCLPAMNHPSLQVLLDKGISKCGRTVSIEEEQTPFHLIILMLDQSYLSMPRDKIPKRNALTRRSRSPLSRRPISSSHSIHSKNLNHAQPRQYSYLVRDNAQANSASVPSAPAPRAHHKDGQRGILQRQPDRVHGSTYQTWRIRDRVVEGPDICCPRKHDRVQGNDASYCDICMRAKLTGFAAHAVRRRSTQAGPWQVCGRSEGPVERRAVFETLEGRKWTRLSGF